MLKEQSFGDRVRAMRVERNLSQEGLATALPKPHHLTWVSRVERGTQDVLLSDLYGLADVLGVSAGWLVHGDVEETEFTSRMRGYEAQLDESGKRTVLAVAELQVEETKKRAEEALNAEEADLLRRFRSLDTETRRLLLATAGEPEPMPQVIGESDREADRLIRREG